MLKKTEEGTKKEPKKQEKITKEEYEKKIFELAEKGLTAEKIGEQLRKQGIHTKEYDKKISKVLKEKGKYINPDLKNIEEKLERIKKHYDKNKQDKRAMRDRDGTAAKLRKIKKYHKLIKTK